MASKAIKIIKKITRKHGENARKPINNKLGQGGLFLENRVMNTKTGWASRMRPNGNNLLVMGCKETYGDDGMKFRIDRKQ